MRLFRQQETADNISIWKLYNENFYEGFYSLIKRHNNVLHIIFCKFINNINDIMIIIIQNNKISK